MTNNQMTAKEYQELKFEVGPQMKYRNKPCEVDGIRFDSQKEAKQYGKYKLLVKSGKLTSFTMKNKYYLEINGVKLGYYEDDFCLTWPSGNIQVVDCKGIRTPIFILKKKLMLAIHGIVIKEI